MDLTEYIGVMNDYLIQIDGGWTTQARYEIEAPDRKTAVKACVAFFKKTYPTKKVRSVQAVLAEDAYKLPPFRPIYNS